MQSPPDDAGLLLPWLQNLLAQPRAVCFSHTDLGFLEYGMEASSPKAFPTCSSCYAGHQLHTHQLLLSDMTRQLFTGVSQNVPLHTHTHTLGSSAPKTPYTSTTSKNHTLLCVCISTSRDCKFFKDGSSSINILWTSATDKLELLNKYYLY